MGKQITNGQRSSRLDEISGRTPVKMLISQEMCGDSESTVKPPSVIARLMGLDSIPVQKWETIKEKVRSNSYLSNGLASELHQCKRNQEEYVDVYEVEQPTKDIWIDEQSVRKARLVENSHKMRTVLVREKFLEAKRLAADGKLLDSQEFQDAVKVLNSNRDLFIKFLEESNSVFTKQPWKPQSLSVPPPSQTTPITVLKPSHTMDRKGNQSTGKQLLSVSDASIGKVSRRYWSTGFCEPKHETLSQRTRIVVLKPSNLQTLQVAHRSSRDLIAADELVVRSRKELGEVSDKEEETPLSSIRKDEALSMSVLSTGYIGDESSFNRSDCVYLEDEVGSTNESDAATSATECSWDYINKISSPFSTSSFNQTSPSPESSVIVEAKKRLSERLAASVASNVRLREFRHLRTTSTLREMLAIPESAKKGKIDEDLTHSNKPFGAEDTLNGPSVLFPTFEENSQRNSLRSSLAHGIDEFNVGLSGSSMIEPTVRTVVPKSNDRKLSFKDKVSSFFFSRSKNPSRDELSGAASVPDAISSFSDTFVPQTDQGSSDESYGRSTEMSMLPERVPKEKSRNFTDSQDKSGHKSASEDMLLLDAENSLSVSFGGTIAARSLCRSPLIKSIRPSYLDLSSTKPSNPFMVFTKADEEYEQFAFLQKLLSSSGMNSSNQMLYRGWYSLDSPLNPSLLNEKSQAMHSSRRLLFDSINTALSDICQSALLAAYPWTRRPVHKPEKEHHYGDPTLAEQVWAILRKGSNGDKGISKDPCSNSNTLDRLMAKEEVVGRQWDATRWLEVCEFSKEIGGKVLEELVEELLSELSPS